MGRANIQVNCTLYSYLGNIKSRGITVDKATLHQLLIKQKDELSLRIEKIEADLKSRCVNARSSQQATDHSNDDVLGGLKYEAQTKLDLTDEAIQRLAEGVFCHCIKCNNEINDERLKALPHTQLCRVCAKKAEAGAAPYSNLFSMGDA